MAESSSLRIGTRGSPLALAQTDEAVRRLKAADPGLAGPGAIEIVAIRTTGDRVLDRPLANIGGKGLFSKEIDAALLEGAIDIAVHSAKDLETDLAPGIMIAAVLEREDPRDAFISGKAARLDDLASASRVGTGSVRRQAQILNRRPDITVVPVRGNVGTRLDKLEAGEIDAMVLAVAGLNRLGRGDAVTEALAPETMLPAVAQGAIAVTCLAGNSRAADVAQAISDAPSLIRVACERAMLAALDGTCRTPIAGLAEIDASGALRLRGLIARPDGSALIEAELSGGAADAEAIGRELGEDLKRRGGPGFLEG